MDSTPRGFVAAISVFALLLGSGCGRSPDLKRPWSAEEARLLRSLCLDTKLPASPGNRFADNVAAAELGKKLFFDSRLSASGKINCASCHDPKQWFTDGRGLAVGKEQTARGAPSIIGSQWLPFVYWDGRKDSLWSQALGPIEADKEHGFSRVGVAHVLARHYREDYEAIFGALPPMSDSQRFPSQARPVEDDSTHPHQQAWQKMSTADREAVNRVFAHFGKAIEAYERKLLPRRAAFDKFACEVSVGDPATHHAALSADALAGARQFIGVGGCVNCHNGPLLTDKGFHNLGLAGVAGRSGVDVGRTLGAAKVKKDPFSCGGRYSDDRDCEELRFLNPRFDDFLGAFKTPTLRNVEKTAPYMHAGQHKTLLDVVNHYKELPGKPRIGHRDLVLKKIDPSVDPHKIVAFLKTLTGPLPDTRWLEP